MATIYLARHGQTDWNAQRRWQGHADPPLNGRGRAESRALGEALLGFGITRAFASDLARARETAEIAAAILGLDVQVDARLREVDVGEWSGLTSAEVGERFPEGYRRRREGLTGWTTGEELPAMARRVVAALEEIASRHPDESVLVVAHGGPLRAAAAVARAGDGWVHAGNCDWDVLVVEAGRMRWLDSTRGGLHQQVQR